jgi:spore coat-associated protein N
MNKTSITLAGLLRLGAGAAGSKLLVSVALVGAAASIAGLGTFATFTSSTPAVHQALTSGTLSIALGATGTSANRLDIGASDIAPGDTLERAVDLSNGASTIDLGSLTLTTDASPSSALDTDAANGLQLAIDKCSVPWTESGPPYTYSCSGTTSTVLASTPVIGTDVALSNLSALTAGQTDHLRVTLSLAATAPNTMQGLASTIGFVFTGVQRAGHSD